MRISGIEAMLRILADCGVEYLFGNPGTTELPLMDALVDHPRLRYILGLQEIPAMAIADGYSQASRVPGVVNLHVSCGLGNAMGMLYNAYRAHTPLIVTAGQQDQRLAFEEPILWGELCEVARPWTKWSAEVRRAADIPTALRRAVQIALAPPQGPVFLSLPLDVQSDTVELDVALPVLPDYRQRPPRGAVLRAAETLVAARNPGVLVGSRIQEADAVEELVVVAEKLGAPVMHEAATSHGRCSFPATHPLAASPLPFWSPDVRQRLSEFDVLLVAGMKMMQQYIYHEPTRAIPESTRLVHLDDSAWEIGKNYPVEVGVLGHPKPALAELVAELDIVMGEAHIRAAQTRGRNRAEKHFQERAALRARARAELGSHPMTPLALMEAVARALPDDVAVVEESPTTTRGYLEGVGALKNTSGYFAQRGWALGWGLNCAIGVQLAWPARSVLGIIGDGSAMYGIQGLWTAARYQIPVTILVTNNSEYRILKDCAGVLALPHARQQRYLGLDLTEPSIDFAGLATSLGVPARRVNTPDELSEALRESWQADGPRLIEAPVRSEPA